MTDCKASKVVIKGKELDPTKLSERIQKKTGRKVEIISPLPKPQESKPEPEPEKKQQPEQPKEEKKDEVTPLLLLSTNILFYSINHWKISTNVMINSGSEYSTHEIN